MALNLSTLTSPATSGDVLAEVLTTADFLEPVPVLRNLARGSQKGGDAEQSVALNQPKALPLIDGDGYLYLSGLTGNYASVLDATELDITGDIDLRVFSGNWQVDGSRKFIVAKQGGATTRSYGLELDTDGTLMLPLSFDGSAANLYKSTASVPFTTGDSGWVRVVRNQSTGDVSFFTSATSTPSWSPLGSVVAGPTSAIFANAIRMTFGATNNGDFGHSVLSLGKIQIYASTDGTDKRLDIDFTATNVRHGATKFACATGQVVTINQSGNDPATIIKKPVLRFSSATSGLRGLFANQIDGGYMFAAFSLLGTGVAPSIYSARVFSINTTGGLDYTGGGGVFSARLAPDNLRSIVDTTLLLHDDLYDSENGDILHEVRLLSGSGLSRVNNADEQTYASTLSLQGDEFNINQNEGRANSENAAMDLEYLALFPATITDAQADAVRNYINNRNTVFYRWDTDGYYFFDPLSLAADAPVSSWNGQIVGSDNDANLTITQSTANSQPDRLAPDKDGMVVRFNDNNDHLIVPAGFVEPADGSWQVVGTSLGTFAYKVNNNAVTELNLLGNLGNASYRQAGDLYGIILLPESATGADIQEARKLLIDRGAADGVTVSSLFAFWYQRGDIVEFRSVDTASVTNFSYAWNGCSSLTSFPLIDTSSGTSFSGAWRSCTSLTSFPLIDTSSGTSFYQAWRSCTSLTSFPLIDTSSGTSFNNAWYNCTSLTSFPLIDTSSGTSFYAAWRFCNSLTSFPAGFFDSWNPSSIASGIFNDAWNGCTSLTAQSVENILVSIDASGKYATSTGASGGTALADAGIDIDYNGDTLSAATTAAITSLKSKGWSIFINSVEQ